MKAFYLFCFVGGLAITAPLPSVAAEVAGLAGVANFHQVNQNLYRGAQPSEKGLKSLADLGVKTIIDLRHGIDRADMEERAAERLGLHYINVPMEGLTAPTDKQIADLLGVLNATDQGPVFVHCREGKDRTGMVIACYRIAHDHWTNDKALEEAKSYGMHQTQHPRQNYILNFSGVQSSTGAPAHPMPVA